MELLFDPAAWLSLVTLTGLEIILGVDNIVVLAILTCSLPSREAKYARRLGLSLALVLRLVLLSTISWITKLTYPVLSVGGFVFSWRDLILMAGGIFLMVKAVQEIHEEIEGSEEASPRPGKAMFSAVIFQIAIMDLIFSLDSIVTAVGLAQQIEVMAAAICISIAIMYLAANATGEFIARHPTVKMLALCFLILIGIVLVADGFGVHVPRAYIYFAMAFAGAVESLNIWAKTAASKPRQSKLTLGRSGKSGKKASFERVIPAEAAVRAPDARKAHRLPPAAASRNKANAKRSKKK
jgi:predicted tellurium resistance membrane protein TerC